MLRTCSVVPFFAEIALAGRRDANFDKFCKAQPQKVLRACQFLTILTSKSLSRDSVVQILQSSTSKSASSLTVFDHFDFQTALARRRGANSVAILGSRSFAPPRFSELTLRAFEATKLWKTQHFAQFLPAKISHVSHWCVYNISAVQHRCCKTYSGNFHYSRKLELLKFLWLSI